MKLLTLVHHPFELWNTPSWFSARLHQDFPTVEATQEAVVNALLAAETTTGKDGWTLHAMPADRTLELMAAAGRLHR